MKLDKKALLLYAVTDRAWTQKQTLYEQVECAIKGGTTIVQLREKKLETSEFLKEAIEIRKLCHKYDVPFIVDDDVEVAIKSGADGIHVGQHDMAAGDVRAKVGDNMILGVSAQTVEQAKLAVKNGADYLGVGAVFSTSTKLDADSVSFETLKEICSAVDVPVCAIGGISKDNISQLAGSGIDGVALVSAIFASDDIMNECKTLAKLSEEMVKA